MICSLALPRVTFLLHVLLPLSAALQELTGSPHAPGSPSDQAGGQAVLPPPPTLDAEEIVVRYPVAAVQGCAGGYKLSTS